ncbi:hypothetical protein P691DRAFT_782562 [Macrolepiota fuliginosa MF-IS2]|uniref:Uncharacterized protein n=1 Tax=Macrolepiota fuliginosa MF-IS2 TaxID=1400762 RepID=A0A9P5XDJ4_9AGAR|nr:hypothetical protein P691DRAFT_782562 [Macrolepiota fuliginosa MF-IS2]
MSSDSGDLTILKYYLSDSQKVERSLVCAATLLVYDSLILLPSSVQADIYCLYSISPGCAASGPLQSGDPYRLRYTPYWFFLVSFIWQRRVTAKSTGQALPPLVLGMRSSDFEKFRCQLSGFVYNLIFYIAYPPLVKVLLILRLLEILSCLIAFLLDVALVVPGGRLANISPVLPGCYLSLPESNLYRVWDKSGPQEWAVRLLTSTIELGLMLFKLVQTFRMRAGGFQSVVTQIHSLTPVLYVFYRDGMLMFIPIFVMNWCGLVSFFKPFNSSTFSRVDWPVWLVMTYHIFGARLILNLRNANAKLIGTTIPQQISTLRFDAVNPTTTGNDTNAIDA